MHEISDLMQSFIISQVINYMIYISIQYFFHHIVIVSDKNYHNMVEKRLYAYVYHIVGYLGKCEVLHEITDLVHEMLTAQCTLYNLPFMPTRAVPNDLRSISVSDTIPAHLTPHK